MRRVERDSDSKAALRHVLGRNGRKRSVTLGAASCRLAGSTTRHDHVTPRSCGAMEVLVHPLNPGTSLFMDLEDGGNILSCFWMEDGVVFRLKTTTHHHV
jgi:hypothetical protein